MNLLKETLDMLAANSVSPNDVEWVQTERGSFTWREFRELADFEYDNGYGGAEVNQALKVVGKDWWLERGEYDGSEWWEFKTMPTPSPSIDLTLADLKDT